MFHLHDWNILEEEEKEEEEQSEPLFFDENLKCGTPCE